MKTTLALLCLTAWNSGVLAASGNVGVPANAIITIEAESFAKQTHTDKRSWHITSATSTPDIQPDGDPVHLDGASGGAYIELLPDTRRSHDDKLIHGENFINKGGEMAVLSYPIKVETPGRYYVWVRAYSTTSEDNGLHFGLDGQWPDSGARWQTVKKNGWNWDCKQRTEEVHIGVPMQLRLDIDKAGEHELLMSMREDGIEVDQIILSSDVNWQPGNNGVPAAQSTPRNNGVPAVAPVPRQPHGKGTSTISGELKAWHKVTLTLDGPFAAESDGNAGVPRNGGVPATPRNQGVPAPQSDKRSEDATSPTGGEDAASPFTDLAFNVTFTHESGTPSYQIPGYFAADGNAANTSAVSGTQWRAHLSPDKAGTWKYAVSFTTGKNAALEGGGNQLAPFDGVSGSFQIAATDKTGRDFRSKGRLSYVGKHHLQFAGSKEYFLKAGPDSPETLLAFSDFDGTEAFKDNVPLKTWAPHAGDWKTGDPTWKDGKGKNLIGALNYLASKGVNAFSFLTYNAAGDGDNVWPFIHRNAKLNYDCSKLDQWGIVFDHATALGLYLHFKLQENESDDNRLGGPKRTERDLPEALDGGKLGIERKLYCREIIARFGHALALNWNIGEENTQSTEEVRDMVKYLHDTDPYKHNIVLHTFPPELDQVYRPLLGKESLLTGVSMQTSWKQSHQKTLQWRKESAAAGRPWVVAHDEQNSASLGVPPDPGYKGFSGAASEKNPPKGKAAEGFIASDAYTLHDVRKQCLWGHFMAGGAGVEYYFGYKLPENDLVLEDFRSRDKSWDYCRIALDFFREQNIPLADMQSANSLIGNTKDNNDKYCLAKPGELYLVYLPKGGSTDIDISKAEGTFAISWFNPRSGGKPADGSVKSVEAGKSVSLGNPPSDPSEDWLILIRR